MRARGLMRGGRGAPIIRGAINIRGVPMNRGQMMNRGGMPVRGRVMRATPRPMVPGRGAPIRVARGGVTLRGGNLQTARGVAARLPINIRPVNPSIRPTVRPGNVRPMLRPGMKPMMRPMMRPGMTMRPVRPMNGSQRPMMRPQMSQQPKINIVFEPQTRAPPSSP